MRQRAHESGNSNPCSSSSRNARRRNGNPTAGSKSILMHRVVAEAWPELIGRQRSSQSDTLDHIDRDVENNNPSNLRWATPVEQAANRSSYLHSDVIAIGVLTSRTLSGRSSSGTRSVSMSVSCSVSRCHAPCQAPASVFLRVSFLLRRRAVRGREPHADVAQAPPPRSRRSPRAGDGHRERFLRVSRAAPSSHPIQNRNRPSH